jgi:hypothetical protein
MRSADWQIIDQMRGSGLSGEHPASNMERAKSRLSARSLTAMIDVVSSLDGCTRWGLIWLFYAARVSFF